LQEKNITNNFKFHLNPVMAGFVIKPEDWKYSSATTFAGLKGLNDLDFIS
jgi:hypothetical protein